MDEIKSDWVKETQREIRSGTYKPKPRRKFSIEIDKRTKRILAIPSTKDKIILEAMRKILSDRFEPTFLNTSHAFRPEKRCQTALNDVKMKFGSMAWIIRADITESMNFLSYHVLWKILAERIHDKGFHDIYWKMVNAGYIRLGNILPSDTKFSQVFSINPLLSNIFLHKLDLWVDAYKGCFDKGTTRRQYPSYTKLTRVPGGAKEARIKGIPSRDPMDPNYRRLQYVRYANNFLFGIIGSKKDAQTLVDLLQKFLYTQLKLTVNHENLEIFHATTTNILFLGTHIRIIPISGYQIKRLKNGKMSRVRSRPQLRIPLKRIVLKLTKLGYLNKKRKS
ncbi:MAG: reverse transcriptase/maturase family protein, partial [Bacteroidota bacterium]